MKTKILLLFCAFSLNQLYAQLVPNGQSGASATAYTNGAPNDPIYIWCAEGLTNNTASMTATPTSGAGPWTFNWYYHNQITASWEPYFSEVASTSTINNVPSDGYRVQIYDNSNAAAGCFTAWVWNMNVDISAAQTAVNCNATNLTGNVNAAGAFTYYNPPPPESLITAATQINVCFSANHTYVSDLAFYLIGPTSAGSPIITLSPNPGANGQGATCNSNNNVNGLCFSSASTATFNPCNEDCCGFLCINTTSCNSNYAGTYGKYGPGNTPINWSALYGLNAAEGGWKVQIFDCIGSDVGSLTNASVTFSNLTSVCGGASSITYTSGAINSAINDNSCTSATASIFQVPSSPTLTTPITINANVSYLWTANTGVVIPNPSTSLTPSVTSTPPGNTTFTLTATASFGSANCTYDDAVSFNSSCCSVTSNAGLDVAFCSGGSATIGSNATGATYSWSPATGISDVTLAQPTVTLANLTGAPITQVYTLTVTDPIDPNCISTDDVTVTVNPLPTVNAGTYTAVCIDAADITLAGTPIGGTFSGVGVSGNSFDPNVGTQQITYASTDGNGCSSSNSTTIVVNNLPNVDAGVDQIICNGSSITLSGANANTYIWNNGVTNGVSFTPVNSSTYTVTGTDLNGCVNTDQLSVTVNAIPTVQLSGTTICSGASTTLTPTLSNPQGTLLWSTAETSGTITVSPLQTTSYSVVHSLNGCNSAPASAIVVVNPAPAINAGVDQVICVGAQVTLTAVGNGTLTWNNAVVNSMPFAPMYTNTYIVTATDAIGCVNSDSVVVTVNMLPSIQAPSDLNICFGTPVVLAGSGGNTYVWSNGVVNGQSFVPTIGSTTYTVTGTDANGCINTDQITVNVVPVPVADFTADVYEGFPILLVSFTQNASGGNNYVWDFGNGITSTSATPSNTFTNYNATGVYTVTLTASNGICSDEMSALIKVLPFPDAEIIVPNVFTPNGDKVNDEFAINVKYGSSISVQIYNRWGNLMTELNSFTEKWDGGDANAGVYFFKYQIKDLNGKEYIGQGNVTLVK